MISLRQRAGCLAVVVALWALGPRAHADDPRGADTDGGVANPVTVARAQQLLRDGNEMFWAGRLSEALQAFEDAYRLYPTPKLYFNIARCESGLDRHARALTHYQQFLRETHEGDTEFRAEAERQVAALIPTVGGLELRQLPANAAVRIDGELAGLTPVDGPLWVEPGAHRLSVEIAGRPPWIAAFDGKPGESIALTMPTPEIAAPPAGTGGRDSEPRNAIGVAPPPPEGAQPSYLRRWWWLWASIASVALIAGGTAIYLNTRCPVTKCE